VRPALLSCGLPASRRRPSALASHWFGAPASWFKHPPRGIRNGGTRFYPNRGDPSSGLGPTSEFELGSATPRQTRRPRSHEVSHPRSATHPPRFTTPGFCLPRSCFVLALTMCLDALLPRWTPWCPSNQARSRGAPFRALPDKDRPAFRRGFPSCDWLPDRRSRH
jgi:hypothetical protein